MVIVVDLLPLAFSLLDELVRWSASLGVLAFGDVTSLNIHIIVLSFSMGAICGIGGVFLATTTGILFGLGFGFVFDREIGL